MSLTSTAVETLALKATYEVPVSEDLVAQAKFEISDYYIVTIDAGQKSMVYFMPDDLTAGDYVLISMPLTSDVSGTKTFDSDLGNATCTGKWIALNCNVKFKNLPLDPEKAESFLQLKYGINEETDKKILVTQKFMNDPIGIIRTDGIRE